MHLDHLLSRLFPVYECCEGLIPASIIHVFKLEGPNWGWLYQLELKPCESGERHMKNLKRSQPGLAVWCHLAASCWILVALAVLHYIYITSCFYWNLWLQKVCSSTFVLLWLLSAKCELWLFSGCLQRHTGKKLGFQFWWLPPTTQCSTPFKWRSLLFYGLWLLSLFSDSGNEEPTTIQIIYFAFDRWIEISIQ